MNQRLVPLIPEESYGKADPLRRVLWRESALGAAIESLAKAAKLEPRMVSVPAEVPEAILADRQLVDRWVEAMADYLHLEADAVNTPYADVEELLRTCAPAIIRIETDRGPRVIAVESCRGDSVTLLGVGGVRERAKVALLRDLLVQDFESAVMGDIERMLERAEVPKNKRARSTNMLLRNRLGGTQIEGIWILRSSPGSSVLKQVLLGKTGARIGIFLFLMFLQIALGMAAWLLIGQSSLNGRVDVVTLQGWALLSLTTVPIGAVQGWLGALIGIDLSAIMKRRLLLGALKLSPSFIREKGSGQLLAMIGESQAVESGGFSNILGIIQSVVGLFAAAGILAAGAGGMTHVGVLAVWTVLVGLSTLFLARRFSTWTRMRMGMTNSLVERMVGHRTRAIQQGPKNRHTDEDDELERYVSTSRSMDYLAVVVEAIPSRGWLAVGFLGMIPGLIAGGGGVASILLSIGGIFAAQGAFGSIVGSIHGSVSFAVAWRSIAPMFNAAAEREETGLPNIVVSAAQEEERAEEVTRNSLAPTAPPSDKPVLDVRNVSFRYRPGGDPVLHNVKIALRQGDRVLLEGKSGGGKSTLAAVLAGLQTPEAGLVLLKGLDRGAIGAAGWRRRVASAPQFHENHIVSGTLAFNLLLGRRWPATGEDLFEARVVCEALELGPLLAKMPSGLDQMLGETGWQLSHGEKSRIFLARALLQDADVVLLDESFGALDPLTLKVCMDATLARAKTLVVIAHP